MALSVGQMIAVSYPAVLNEKRKAANQWVENAALREFERLGIIKREPIGPTIERTLNYRRNPGAAFLSFDLEPVSMVKTEILTAAVFTPASISVPMVWSKEDEAKNDGELAKVKLVKEIQENGIDSHDEVLEEAVFATTTNGFLGLQNLVPDSGQGSPGGINAAIELWWRNTSLTYLTAGTDIEAKLTAGYNAALKGSGSSLAVNCIISSSDGQATYEASQQSLKRYVDTKEADVGFKVLAFKTARFSFTQWETRDAIYMLNSKVYNISASRSAFRQLGDTIEIPSQNGFIKKIFTLCQATINNKSRLVVITKV